MIKNKLKIKELRQSRKSIHVNKLKPELQAFGPNLPWHDFSLEGGYIFSHLDGQMVGCYETNSEEISALLMEREL